MGSKIERVIVMGTGAFSFEIATFLQQNEVQIEFLESRKSPIGSNESKCLKSGIPFSNKLGEALTEYLLSLTEHTLIISVANRYLFPESVVIRENLEIINYHGSLLPNHPGRNSEAWAIYSLDQFSGITWHYVTKEVDAGRILAQKKVALDSRINSIRLLKLHKQAALSAFKDFIFDLLSGLPLDLLNNPLMQRSDIKMHYSWEVPNEGFLDRSWGFNQTSAFLRSLDYGPLNVFPKAKLIGAEGQELVIRKYQIREADFEVAQGKEAKLEVLTYPEGKIIIYIEQES